MPFFNGGAFIATPAPTALWLFALRRNGFALSYVSTRLGHLSIDLDAPLLMSSVASERVLKNRATQSHFSVRMECLERIVHG